MRALAPGSPPLEAALRLLAVGAAAAATAVRRAAVGLTAADGAAVEHGGFGGGAHGLACGGSAAALRTYSCPPRSTSALVITFTQLAATHEVGQESICSAASNGSCSTLICSISWADMISSMTGTMLREDEELGNEHP